MRLVYLDEAGTTSSATSLVVAGVIVEGDHQWPKVDDRIAAIVEKYIPEEDRLGFAFHATDIFHGSRYFDRRNPDWATREQRWPILEDLAQIVADLELPVVLGTREKVQQRWSDADCRYVDDQPHPDVLHLFSVIDCLYWADLWLAANAPDERATVIHEDGSTAKPVIKRAVRALRTPEALIPDDREWYTEAYALPFDHIVDTVHFAEKSDARLLQLADLCAFIVSRAVQGRSVPTKVLQTVLRQVDWMADIRDQSNAALAALLRLSPHLP